ncbi:MAG TPA: hypothetical protein VIL20_17245 [Sandaracinaceae bacterium]
MANPRARRALVALALIALAAGAGLFFVLRRDGAREADRAAPPEPSAEASGGENDGEPAADPRVAVGPRFEIAPPPGPRLRPSSLAVDDGGVRASPGPVSPVAPVAPIALPRPPPREATPESNLRFAEGVQRYVANRLAELTAQAEEARAAGREAQARRLERAIERLRREQPFVEERVEALRRAVEEEEEQEEAEEEEASAR